MKNKMLHMGIWLLFLCLLAVLLSPVKVYAENKASPEEILKDMDLDEVQEVIDDVMLSQETFSFSGYVKNLISGEQKISVKGVLSDMKNAAERELQANYKSILKLVTIAVIAAIFTNFSNVFSNSQIAETGFYITYLLIFTILTTSFMAVSSVAGTALTALLKFMKALVPAYFLAIAFTVGAKTSLIFYEAALLMITCVDFVLIHIVLPVIRIYFIITLANNISKEDMLSKLSETLKMGIQWTLKTMLAAVIGFHTIQGMIVPAAEQMKKTVLMKASSSIPGIGNAINTVTETILGAGMLVKNAVGVAGIVVIAIICAIPIIKLALYVILYKLGSVVIQPVSDKRIINCLSGSAEAARLLLYMVFICMILFLLSIAIVAVTTNR